MLNIGTHVELVNCETRPTAGLIVGHATIATEVHDAASGAYTLQTVYVVTLDTDADGGYLPCGAFVRSLVAHPDNVRALDKEN